MKVWLDGNIIDAAEARIDPADRGFTLADGLFETMRARNGKALRLSAHLARLHAGSGALGIPIPCSDKDLTAALAATLAANSLAEGMLRLTLTRGVGPRGLLPPDPVKPTLLITAVAVAAEPPPARVIIATVTRRNEFSPTSRFKTLNYLDNVLARREAAAKQADDALLLNSQGRLVESTVANLFLVIDGDVLTPPVAEGALPGVMRAEVIDRLGAATAQLNPADLASATEAFLTNSSGIRALIAVDGKPVGAGREGPVTTRLKGVVV